MNDLCKFHVEVAALIARIIVDDKGGRIPGVIGTMTGFANQYAAMAADYNIRFDRVAFLRACGIVNGGNSGKDKNEN